MKKFNKTLAIALAAGVSFSGVVVPATLAPAVAVAQGVTAQAQTIDGIKYTAPHRFSAEDVEVYLQLIVRNNGNAGNKTDYAFKVIPGENDQVLLNGDVKVPYGTWVRGEVGDVGGNPAVQFEFKPDSKTPLTPDQEIASAIIVENLGYTSAFVPSTDPRGRTSQISKAAPGQKGTWIDVSKVIPRGYTFDVTNPRSGFDDRLYIDPAGDWEYDTDNGRLRFIPAPDAPAATTQNQYSLRVTNPANKENGVGQYDQLYVLGYQKQPESSSYNIELKMGDDGVARSKPVDLRFVERVKGVSREEYDKLSRDVQNIVDHVNTKPWFFLGDLPGGSTVEERLDFGGKFINQLGMTATVPGQGKWGVEEQDDRTFVFTFTPENNTVKSGSVNYRGFNADIAAVAYMGDESHPLTDYRKQLEKDTLWDKGTLFYKIVDDFSANPVEEIVKPDDIFVEKAEVSKPDKNGNVTVTLTYNDTSKKPLTFTIPVGKDGIQDVKVEGGKLVVIDADGTKREFPLTKTTVTEDKAKKTVTIVDDNGNKVTFSTEDLHITDVKKLDNGDYEVTRSDGEKWTISTSELQKQIDNLGSKLDETNKDLADLKETAASKEEVAKLKEELAKHTEQLADHEQRLKELEANGATKDDIAALEKEIADNKAAIDRITEQITTIITRIEILEKGVADNAQDIEGLKKDLGDVTEQVEKNTGDIANNSKDIADLRDKVDNNTAEIADLKEKVVTKEQLLEVVKQVENHEKRITDLENQGASKEELAKTQAELDELKNKLAELENKVADKADVEKLEREIADHADKIAALEKETAELNSKLVELTRVVTERFEKVTERIESLETRADETDKALDALGNRVTETEVSIQNIKVDITKLGDRIDGIEVKIVDLTKRVEGLEAEVKDLRKNNQCLTTMSRVSLIAAIVGPLLAIAAGGGSGSQANVDIQKQLGIYNPEMAKMMADNQGVIKALSAVAALAAGLGILGYVSDKCGGVENLLAPGLKEKVAKPADKPAEAPKVPAEAK